MIDWKTKLTSRKLWVAVTEFVSMLMVAFGYAQDTVTQVAALIMAGAGLIAYIVAEGLVDAKAASSTPVFHDIGADYILDEENDEATGQGDTGQGGDLDG